jgi:chorismate mutase/prephenate dehydratase
MDKLKLAREQINEIDTKMAELFEKRMTACEIIAKYKSERGLPIYDKAREDEILASAPKRISKDGVAEYYVEFQKNLMATSRSYQSRIISGMRVAFSGTVGAFAHLAVLKLFPSAVAVPYSNFSEAYAAVENAECDAAVLPMENSYHGEVGQVTDLMFSGSLYINSVTELFISQDLLCVEGATLSDIKTVISHPQALGQCASFIEEHGFQTREYENTALAASYVAEMGDKSLAAIASAEAAEIFSLCVLRENINASRNNTTRFAVFSRVPAKHKNSHGVSSILLFTVRNEAGSLAKAIDIIGKHGFNMKSLRSRPMKNLLWQYYFYIELEGDVGTSEGDSMLSELCTYCDKLKFIGTYLNYEE